MSWPKIHLAANARHSLLLLRWKGLDDARPDAPQRLNPRTPHCMMRVFRSSYGNHTKVLIVQYYCAVLCTTVL